MVGVRASCRTVSRRAFTVVELIVVTAIIGLLVSLAMPALSRVRMAAKRIECANNVRNIAMAVSLFDTAQRRLPASGLIGDPDSGTGGMYHSWAVSILPHLDQTALFTQWNLDQPVNSATNLPLARSRVPVYLCPMDISRSDDDINRGDLSYVVNGGFGFTVQTSVGVRDCPFAAFSGQIDFDGDGNACSGTAVDDADRRILKQTGLFFLENWKGGNTVRYHSLADIRDGTSQTFMIAENARVGYSPTDDQANFASSHPYRCAFYVQSPCLGAQCSTGQIDFRLCNSGAFAINSGISQPEGGSSVPNSFHDGGINMAYADGHVTFLSEKIDGAVYAALASPQGQLLENLPLKQAVLSDGSY